MRDIWESQSKKRIMKERIERTWGQGMFPSDEEISHAKWLGDGCLFDLFAVVHCKYHASLISEARALLDFDKIKRLVKRVGEVFDIVDMGMISEFMCGASLAHHGLLYSVREMRLYNIDLSPVPAQHLASLVSLVFHVFCIKNVSGCDLVSLLTNLKCREVSIDNQSLGREETRALVRAMESHVEALDLSDDVTLDVEALAEYSGQGQCRGVRLWGSIGSSLPGTPLYQALEEELSWARTRNWGVEHGADHLKLFRAGK